MKYREIMNGVWPVILAVVAGVVIVYLLANRSVEAPTEMETTERQEVRLHLNERGSALGLTVLPITLMEDSRCPEGVQCIQAGTVKVQTQIIGGMGPSVMVMEMGKPITTEAEEVTLQEVTPAPTTGTQITKPEYVFVFEVKKRPLSKINP